MKYNHTIWIQTGHTTSCKGLKLGGGKHRKITQDLLFYKVLTCALEVSLIAEISQGENEKQIIEIIGFSHIACNFYNSY